MGISVTKLRDQLTGGGARPSLFYAKIDFTNLFSNTGLSDSIKNIVQTGDKNNISFFMKASQIPESSLNAVPMNFLGREFKVPSTDRTFQDWTVQVINDEDFRIRHVFESWIEHITPGGAIFDTQAAFGTDNSVFCNMEVHQLKKSGAVSSYGTDATNSQYFGSYYFVDAFPTNVSGIDLSWDTKDSIEEFSVQFAYQYWEKIPTLGTNDTDPNAQNPFQGDDSYAWADRKKKSSDSSASTQ